MKKIKLYGKYGKGKYAIVDDEDFDAVNKYRWNLSMNGYVRRTAGQKGSQYTLFLHRYLFDDIKDKDIDHINHNKLDNQRKNLRACTRSENMGNAVMRSDNSSGYKGVSWHKKSEKWRAYIQFNKKHISLGFYTSKKDAAKAYQIAADKYFKDYKFNHSYGSIPS